MDKNIIINLSLDELEVISESLDLLKHNFKVDITVGKVNIQDVIDRVDRVIDKIEKWLMISYRRNKWWNYIKRDLLKNIKN